MVAREALAKKREKDKSERGPCNRGRSVAAVSELAEQTVTNGCGEERACPRRRNWRGNQRERRAVAMT